MRDEIQETLLAPTWDEAAEDAIEASEEEKAEVDNALKEWKNMKENSNKTEVKDKMKSEKGTIQEWVDLYAEEAINPASDCKKRFRKALEEEISKTNETYGGD